MSSGPPTSLSFALIVLDVLHIIRLSPVDSDRLNLSLFLRNPFIKHCPSGKLGQVYTWWHNTYVEAAVPSVPHLSLLLLLFLLWAFDRNSTSNCFRFSSLTLT